jgi:hypothetical protein
MRKITKLAVGVVAIYAAVQVGLVFYSVGHPAVNGIITGLCAMSIVLYPAIGRYRAKKVEELGGRASELPRGSSN